MVLPIRRRWVWLFGLLAGLIAVTALVSVSVDEPARRYMEREINRRLTGYTVELRALHVHPWTVSLELLDSTISQDANPAPPVARIPSLTASLHWLALTHGKVAADITFDQPVLYVNLNHLRAEAKSDVALKDRGWQRALEAVALDLKINRLGVRQGDLTYIDSGPFKPLHLSRLNLTAENILNIRSKDLVYPSEVHLEGVVFDAGRLRLEGHADFLAEPHPGVQAALRLEQIELDYFRPIINRYNLSVTHGTLSLAGDIEYAPDVTRLVLGRVLVQGAHLEYVHTPGTALAEKARAQRTIQAAKWVTNEPSVELRIDRLDVARSTLGFASRADKPYRVVVSDMDLTLENLSNQRIEGTAVARLSGRFMGSGETRLEATVAPRAGGADMNLSARIERTEMTRMNDLVRAYGGFDVAAGDLSVYSEIQVKNGAVTGYVKPLFRDVQVGAVDGPEEPKTLGRRLYEGAMGVAAKLLKNRSRREVATVVTISGRADQPEFSTWEVAGRLLQNAFFKAILPGFESGRSPKAPQPSSGAAATREGRPPTAAPR
jgi:hypothetical protein